MKRDLLAALERASADVLETMFFAESSPSVCSDDPCGDYVRCRLACTGAVNGSFSLSINRELLQNLSEGFYGDEKAASAAADEDLACELTNMIAGSTLSTYLPMESCALSSPMLCSLTEFESLRRGGMPEGTKAALSLALDGGTLSLIFVLGEAA